MIRPEKIVDVFRRLPLLADQPIVPSAELLHDAGVRWGPEATDLDADWRDERDDVPMRCIP